MKANMARPDLLAIEKRANAASAGPWTVCNDGAEGLAVIQEGGTCAHPVAVVDAYFGPDVTTPRNLKDWDDAWFIAYAREDIPALLAYCKRLEAVVEALSKVDP